MSEPTTIQDDKCNFCNEPFLTEAPFFNFDYRTLQFLRVEYTGCGENHDLPVHLKCAEDWYRKSVAVNFQSVTPRANCPSCRGRITGFRLFTGRRVQEQPEEVFVVTDVVEVPAEETPPVPPAPPAAENIPTPPTSDIGPNGELMMTSFNTLISNNTFEARQEWVQELGGYSQLTIRSNHPQIIFQMAQTVNLWRSISEATPPAITNTYPAQVTVQAVNPGSVQIPYTAPTPTVLESDNFTPSSSEYSPYDSSSEYLPSQSESESQSTASMMTDSQSTI